MPRNALMVSIALLVAAIIFRGFLGAALAAAAAVPAGYAVWEGAQEQGQGRMARAMVCLVVSLLVAVGLIVLRVLRWV